MKRARTPDWGFVGWHYKLLHATGGRLHNKVWVRAKGLENLPKVEGYLYAANHTSWWDPIVLQTTSPRPVNWLAKKEMMNSRFNRWFFFDKGGCIPVDRNGRNPEAFAAAVQALRDGRAIGIFPEGTRHAGGLGPSKTGVARLAMASGAPVVPAALLTDRFWGPERRFPKLTETVRLHVGTPFHLKGDPQSPEDARRGTAEVMAAIGELLGEARRARDARERWARP